MTRTPTPPLKTRPESTSSGSRRASILAAARKLVGGRGFRDTQMTAIAEEAGVALNTLYRYFPSKSGLMVEVVALVSQREVDVAAEYAMAEGPAVDRLGGAAWVFAGRALRGRRLAHALVAEPVEPEIEAARLLFRQKLGRVFETIIHQGVRNSEFPDQNIPAAAACIVGSLFEGLVGPLAFDLEVTDRDRENHAASVVTFCMRAVTGRELTFTPDNRPIAAPSRGR